MHVNGAPRGASFRRVHSYVPQHDALMGVLTVRETLRFSAELAGETDQEVLAKSVSKVAQSLGLTKVLGAWARVCVSAVTGRAINLRALDRGCQRGGRVIDGSRVGWGQGRTGGGPVVDCAHVALAAVSDRASAAQTARSATS